MQPQTRDLRLRLAARSLIEWKTPRTNPHYKRVLSALLQRHTLAAGMGFTAKSPILSLDDRESVLWYLSESFEENVKIPRVDPRQARKMLRLICEPTLASCGLTNAEPYAKIWDAIYSSDHERRSCGLQALVALALRIPDIATKTLAEPGSAVLGGMMRRFRRVARLYLYSDSVNSSSVLAQYQYQLFVRKWSSMEPFALAVREFPKLSDVEEIQARQLEQISFVLSVRFLLSPVAIVMTSLVVLKSVLQIVERIGSPFGISRSTAIDTVDRVLSVAASVVLQK